MNEDAELKEKISKSLEKAYFSENCDEKDIIDALPKFMPKNLDYFIDVGASLGQYTYNLNKILNNSTIIAIEADPIRYEILKEKCLTWQINSTNKIIPLNLHFQK